MTFEPRAREPESSADPLISRMQTFGTTIFAEMSALATRTGSVNLGQGFPDYAGPSVVLDAAIEAIRSGANQYPPGRGIPALRQAIADHQRHWYGLDIDPDTEVLVTVGATEAIAACVQALVEPGDEVVVLDPTYDSYDATIALAGAVARHVPLLPPSFALQPAALAAAFSERTRLVLLNTPHNPTGRVLTREELMLVAELATRYGALIVADEVYEHLVFDGRQHVPIATLPGMAERTLTIGSAGKTFSVTGWKVGWVTGPARLVTAVTTVKQFLTYVGSGPLQPGVAVGLAEPDSTFAAQAQSLARRRDLLRDGLAQVGFDVLDAESGYFLLADAAPLGADDGVDFCWDLPERVGVVAIPARVFCADPDPLRSYVRFAFCKREEVLLQALERLGRLSG
ncbi:MAG: pyridoxal phosphate-dependent aminotransferase [Actinomycetales bacterium]